jgi:hypothetical protein
LDKPEAFERVLLIDLISLLSDVTVKCCTNLLLKSWYTLSCGGSGRRDFLMVFAGFRRATGVDALDLAMAEFELRERFSFGSGVVEAVVDFSIPRGIGVLVLRGL